MEKRCSQPSLEKLVFPVNGGERNSETHGPTKVQRISNWPKIGPKQDIDTISSKVQGTPCVKGEPEDRRRLWNISWVKHGHCNYNLTAAADACAGWAQERATKSGIDGRWAQEALPTHHWWTVNSSVNSGQFRKETRRLMLLDPLVTPPGSNGSSIQWPHGARLNSTAHKAKPKVMNLGKRLVQTGCVWQGWGGWQRWEGDEGKQRAIRILYTHTWSCQHQYFSKKKNPLLIACWKVSWPAH